MYQAYEATTWRPPLVAWSALFIAMFLIGFVFYDSIQYLVAQWELPEYSYGYLIPPIALFFVWQRRDELVRDPFKGSWFGGAVVLVGLVLYAAGRMAAVHTVIHYAMVLVIAGLALAYVGIRRFRAIRTALLLLLFMVPLPGFLYESLSNELQLVSSRLGVWFIRLFDISVFLEGNVIDLGTMKLQVVEACSGLRYLFPLMTLGFIATCFYRAPFWKRAVIFLSTIPITVLMNSFRIGVIGILVEYWGREMAEGFLHDFEGWIVFMACTAVLILEMWVLAKVGKEKKRLRDVFDIDLGRSAPASTSTPRHPLPMPFVAGVGLLAMAAALAVAAPERKEIVPDRAYLSTFPSTIDEWRGESERMETAYVDALNFDDYLLANFFDGERRPVNLYIGYYATQHPDKVPHSPRACLPGGGWLMTNFDNAALDAIPLRVNRVVIEQNRQRHLVYYWFKQRDRNVTNEYLVKWFLFWDSVTRRRSDGALIRLTTPLAIGEDVADADRRLAAFAARLAPLLPRYVPD